MARLGYYYEANVVERSITCQYHFRRTPFRCMVVGERFEVFVFSFSSLQLGSIFRRIFTWQTMHG
jgi:hypothetical protein